MKMDIHYDGVFFRYDNVIKMDIKDEKLTFNYIDQEGEEHYKSVDIPDFISVCR